MKKLEIIITPEHLSDLNTLLHKHKVGGMSFFDVKGRGRAKQQPVKVKRGVTMYVPEFGFGTKIEVLVPDQLAEKIVDDVLKTFGTGNSAIGKIFVYEVAEAYDLGTKNRGDYAL